MMNLIMSLVVKHENVRWVSTSIVRLKTMRRVLILMNLGIRDDLIR